MSAMSDYLETQFIKHLLRTGSWTKPAAIYVSLHTESPLDAGTGTEVSGGSYARVQHGPADDKWTAAGANIGTITFPAPTANWGLVTHFGAWDAASGGNLLFHGALASQRLINNGDAAPSFQDGDLVATAA